MVEKDTVRLLRECDAGIKMGIDSIEEVADDISSPELEKLLLDCKDKHRDLQNETAALLGEYHDEGKEPNPMAKTMSFLKTEFKLLADKSDSTIADLMTDGCDMGVKSLSRYLNQYAAADEKSKDIAKRLIALEADLSKDLRGFL